jgi:ABC-type branched-subunit amino acid transport system substrate-binding protein
MLGRRAKWWSAPVVVAAVVALGVAGCASSASNSSSTSSSTGSAQAGSIYLGLIGPFSGVDASPEIEQGVQASIDALNAEGGVRGKSVKLVVCNTNFQPAVSAACWRKITSNSSVLAVMEADTFGDASAGLLNNSKMLDIAFPSGSNIDTSNPYAYPNGAGLLAVYQATAAEAVAEGGTHASVIGFAIPQAAPLLGLEKQVVAAAGGTVGKTLTVDPNTIDYTTPVAQMLSTHPNALIITLPVQQAVEVIRAARSQGFTGIIAVGMQPFSNTQLASLGSAGNGIVGAQLLPPANETEVNIPGLTAYNAAMDKFAPNTVRDDLSVTAYASVQEFAAAAQQAPALTRAGLLAGIAKVKNFSAGGLYVPFNFAKPGPMKGLANIINPYTIWVKVSRGAKVWDGKFHDVVNGDAISAAAAQ